MVLFTSHSASAQTCLDLGFNGIHIDVIQRPDVTYNAWYYDIVTFKIPTNHPTLGDGYLTPVGSTTEQVFGNSPYQPFVSRMLSGSLLQQYGSSDFKLTSLGPGYYGADADSYQPYYYQIAFTPTTSGPATGVAVIEFTGISMYATDPYEDYQFTQKICYQFSSIADGGSSAPDLAIGATSIPNTQLDPNGLPIISVGVPTQINVPVSLNYTGTLTPEQLSSFVPVTLQVGSYSATKYVSIAELAASQNYKELSFSVTFDTQDVGLKTIIATVNASGLFTESNYQNNSVQQLVNVVDNKYKIVKYISVNGSLKDSESVSIAPSKEEGCRSTNTSIAQIVLRCFKEIPGSIVDEAVDGCKIKTSLELSMFLGTHSADHDQSTRPMGSFSPNTNIDYVNIPKTGLSVNYTASEVAGGYIVNFDALDPDGNSIVDVNETLFRVETQTFFLPFVGIPGLKFQNLDSHRSDDMVWGTSKMHREVEAAVRTYFFRANNHPVIGSPDYIFNIFDNPNISPIYSEGVSLKYGGMFDVDKHWRTLNPSKGHCLHRRGIDIDFSLSTFNNRFREQLKEIWARSIREKNLVMRETNERPEDPGSNHWHAQLKTN